MKRVLSRLAVLIMVAALTLMIFRVVALSMYGGISEPTNTTHIIGGFSIDTPIRLTRAAGDGVQVVFYYGQPPSESSVLGQKLASLHMKVVDGFISSYLRFVRVV